MRHIWLACVALAALNAPAAGDAAAGKEKAAMCAVCHGLDGVSKNPDAPNLSGQLQRYLIKSITAFKTGERKNEQMTIIAEGLEESDIADLAAYYSSIKITVEKPQ
jgi:cytochrome c553